MTGRLVFAFFVGLVARAACGQSPVVFLSEASRIIRFDAGAESSSSVVHENAYFMTALNGSLIVAGTNYIETDSKGNIYLGPPRGLRPTAAVRFTADGSVTQTFNVPYGSGFNGIDADADGNVYLLQSGYLNNYLYKFAPDGTFLNHTLLSFVVSGNDIAIDEVGKRLFVADEFGGNQGIKIFDISGATPTYMSSITTPDNSNYFGIDYAEESGDVLVADLGYLSHDPRGVEYSPNGTLLREYRAFNQGTVFDIVAMRVPEPSTAALLVIGCAVFARRLAGRRC
jgi:DNA-binding beta-propeller fold protein YncE